MLKKNYFLDHPTVRTTVDWSVKHNKNFNCLCNGESLGEIVAENDQEKIISKWILEYPCPSYLLCFIVGEYMRYDEPRKEGEIPISYFGLKVILFKDKIKINKLNKINK